MIVVNNSKCLIVEEPYTKRIKYFDPLENIKILKIICLCIKCYNILKRCYCRSRSN